MNSFSRLFLCFFSLLLTYSTQAQTHEWSYNLGSTSNDEGRKIATDDQGDVYITGVFTGTVDFNPGIGTINRTSAGGQDGYVVKLSKAGVFQYVYTFGGTTNDLPIDIAVADDGTVYLVGVFRGTTDFNPTSLFGFNRTSNGLEDLFLLRLNPAGVFQWVVNVGGTQNDGAHDVEIDSNGDVIITGGFEGLVINFNPLGTASNRTALGDENVFVAKYQNNGLLTWVRSFGNGTDDDLATGIAVDSNDDVYICGHFEGNIDFIPGAAGGLVTNASGRDGFLLKYNAAGTEQWYRHYDGTLEVIPRAVTVSHMDEVYVTGYFQSSGVDFDGTTLNSAGATDIFIGKYDINGTQEWMQRYGNTRNDVGEDVVVAPCGNVFFGGSVEGTVDFDPSAGVANVVAPFSSGFFTNYGYFGASLSETGNLRWASGGGNASGTARINGIALDDCENVIATGVISAATPLDFNSAALNSPVGGTDFFVSKHTLPNVTVSNTLSANRGSFHNAIDCANTRIGRDTVLFCLRGVPTTVHTFTAPISQPTIIDDSTIVYAPSQPDYFLGKILMNDPLFVSNSDYSEVHGLHINGNAGNLGLYLLDSNHGLLKDNVVGGSLHGVRATNSKHLRVEGNILGLEPDGISPDGNTSYGIILEGDSRQVGGTTAAQSNIIASNQHGIALIGDHNIIQGNIIGTDLSQTLVRANTNNAITIFTTADSNLIGGSIAGAGNVISNSNYGIFANSPSVSNTFSQNSIYCNSLAGIELGGANNGMGFPVIVTPDLSGVSGTANPGEVVELFENNTSGCLGAPCQGKTFLGSAITNAGGIWNVAGPFPIGMSVTATATDAQGNTSEFSLCNAIDALLKAQQTIEEALTPEIDAFIRLSPNPTHDLCQLTWPYEGSVQLRLLNPKGQVIMQKRIENIEQTSQLDLRTLAQGIYIVEVMSSSGERQTAKILKR
ncbi:MAG: T9SS type A sorting domain-containing protein [Bacteroidia bacterium]